MAETGTQSLTGTRLDARLAIKYGQETIFTNLPALVVGGFQAAEGIGAGWIDFDYQLEGFAGVGLATGALSPAGELVLDLGLDGWHILHFCHNPLLDIWLDGERGFRQLEGTHAGSLLGDFAIHAADLTGRKLHIAPKRGVGPRELVLFYIRAEPCDGPRRSRRNLVATEDGHGVFWHGIESIREIYRYFYPYRDSDFFRVLWGVFGGGDFSANPESKVATHLPMDTRHAFYANEWTFAESIRRVMANGDDILATVVDAARDTGLEVHFHFRVGAGYGPFPHHGNSSDFYADNPQLRCRDELGREVKRLSYAFPEVQDHMLSYFEELLDYDPDGLCLACNRGLPMMVCEEPVLAEFRRRHGRSPQLPDEVDFEEMLAVRHALLADFFERVNRLVASRGKALSCIVPRNFYENRLRGLDIELLLQRGLLESVMVGAGHEDNPAYTSRNNQPPVAQDDLEPIERLKAIGTAKIYLGGCSNHGTFWPPDDPLTRARRMHSILTSELDGAYFWDTCQWWGRDWDDIRRYGDLAHVEKIVNGQAPAPTLRDTLTIHDLVADRYSPWNAH